MRRHRRRSLRAALATAVLALAVTATIAPAGSPPAVAAQGATRLHLVVLEGPGTSGHQGDLSTQRLREVLRRQQDAALAAIGSPQVTYRWTTALSGVAVPLTDVQAEDLRAEPMVVSVEENGVRPLAATRSQLPSRAEVPGGRGGAGVVVGVVDSGLWPESPLFAGSPGLGRPSKDFAGTCETGEDWGADSCSGKLVGARWFVEGFGRDQIASAESLSARDIRGHGTQVASVAVGNAGVSTGVPGLPEQYAGIAPRARLAVYKACWSAPDPRDDGCSTADLVTAIDRAVADGVDVLNLSVAGAPGIGAVERALLGAAEADTVVVAAAGNDGGGEFAAPGQPWVTTVGGLTGTGGSGTVALPGGPRLTGAMTLRREVRAPVVLAREVPAPGSSPSEAAQCVPGSLDASRVAGRVVVCARGDLGRLEKSRAVQGADGVGMVLVNVDPGNVAYDLHAVPTVHLQLRDGRTLARWVSEHPDVRVRLVPQSDRRSPLRVAGWSAGGDPTGSFVKPDLVAPATGVLAATPPGAIGGGRWGLLNGTSAASARTAGAAAVLLSRHDWSAPVVRSVLSTSTARVTGGALRTGAGRTRLDEALRTRLAYDVDATDYRAWLDGEVGDVNTPSLLLRGDDTRATRTITNLDDRARYWSVRPTGFARHDVQVRPAAVRLAPGESATYTVSVADGPPAGGLDDGVITWRGADRVRVRIPVVIGR